MISLAKHTGIKNLKIKKIFIFVLLISLFAQNAYAVVKVDDPCYKIGKTKTVKQNKYFCVKKENGLSWSKEVKNPKPETKTGIESVYDLSKNIENISYQSWKNSNSKILNSSLLSPKINIMLSPDLKNTIVNDDYKVFDLVAKLYDNYAIPKAINIIYYTAKDMTWAQDRFTEYALFSEGNEASNGCRISGCSGAQARIGKNKEGLILIGVWNVPIIYQINTIDAHEFSHTIQSAAFFGTKNEYRSNWGIKQYMPAWLVEGGSNFSQLSSVFYNNFIKYKEERKNLIYSLVIMKQNKQIDTTIIENFLLKSNPNNDIILDYQIGMLSLEAMVAIKGPGIQMDLISDIANGKSFEESFEYRFGLSWEKAVPFISDYIYKSIDNVWYLH
jgi:hypothetical protein